MRFVDSDQNEDAVVSDLPVTAARYLEGPPSDDSAGSVQGDFRLPGSGDEGFGMGEYPVLSTGNKDLWGARPASDYDRNSSRGQGVFDATSWQLDIEVPAAAECVVVEYLFASTADADDHDMFLIEWGDSTWSRSAEGTVSAPNSLVDLFDDNYEPVGRKYVSNDDHTWYNQLDKDYVEHFRFDNVARMTTHAVLPDDSNRLTFSIADGGHGAGDTAVAIESVTFMVEPLCQRGGNETRTLWSEQRPND